MIGIGAVTLIHQRPGGASPVVAVLLIIGVVVLLLMMFINDLKDEIKRRRG